MRYALVSDLHANLQAWIAVLTDIQSTGVDEIICLGDIVGYGPSPAPVLEQVYARVHHFVLGNHDAVVAGRLDSSCFNERAQSLIEWTSRQLDTKAGEFFRSVPYVIEGNGFRCVHGSPSAPARFGYVLDAEQAKEVWQCCPEQFVFIGHSHVPGLFVVGNSGVPHWLDPRDFAAEANKRYIVNVGSVGQPRRNDVRATYVIFDDEAGSVWFRQVPFDLEAYKKALDVSDIPSKTTHFLAVAESSAPPPLREMLEFSPLKEHEITDTDIGVARLEKAVEAARWWRRSAFFSLLLLLLVIAGGTWLFLHYGKEYTEYAALDPNPLPLAACNLTCLPELTGKPGEIGPENRLNHWTIQVARPKKQHVLLLTEESDSGNSNPNAPSGPMCLEIVSAVSAPVSLISRSVQAEKGMRFQLMGVCKALEPLAGHLELGLLQVGPDGRENLILHYPIENVPEDRWKPIRKSSDPDGISHSGPVCWVLRGQFTGRLLLRNCDLKRIQ